ncbi:MAG: hypothetical protein HFH84_19580 [Lachnospiraceae bacterium]|nr:hypothetical protein [Lachnospiraceae bacterium]
MRKIKRVIEIELDSEDLDRAIEKADRLVGLLQEAQQIIDSLSGREVSSIPERDLRHLRETAIQSISNSLKKTVECMADSL